MPGIFKGKCYSVKIKWKNQRLKPALSRFWGQADESHQTLYGEKSPVSYFTQSDCLISKGNIHLQNQEGKSIYNHPSNMKREKYEHTSRLKMKGIKKYLENTKWETPTIISSTMENTSVMSRKTGKKRRGVEITLKLLLKRKCLELSHDPIWKTHL